MRGYFNLVGVCALLLASGAAAQTTVTTSGGTPNTVPLFTGTATVGNSPMTVDGNGNVNAVGLLNGAGNFNITGTGGSWSWEKIGTFTATQGGENIQISASIHNGVNASNGQDSTYFINFKTSNDADVDAHGFAGNGYYYAIGFNGTIPPGSIKWVANAPGVNATAYDLYILLPSWTVISHYTVSVDRNSTWTNVGTFASSDPGPASSSILILPAEFDLPYGNMGIGTGSPGAKLEVNGNIKLTSGSGASITFADGTVQSTAWTGSLCGGDYAEAVSGAGDRAQYEPGDILVLSDDDHSDVSKSTKPYSSSVAGIYSTKPGLIGRRHPGKSNTEIPMAMVGIVPTKVSAENGPIRRGDLLVTSSTAGYAMKGTDRSRMLGAIVGKAMGTLKSGTGVIEVLVSLQ